MYWTNLPFVKLIIPLILGIICADLFIPAQMSLSVYWLTLIFLLLLIALYFSRRKTFFWVVSLLIFLLAAFLHTKQAKLKDALPAQAQSVPLRLKISEVLKPSSRFENYRIEISAIKVDQEWEGKSASLLAHLEKDQLPMEYQLLAGDHLMARGDIRRLRKARIPGTFDYSAYLNRQGIFHEVYLQDFVKYDSSFTLGRFAYQQRHRIEELFRKDGLEAEPLSLLKAIYLGDKSDLQAQMRSNFSKAGAMHVLAVSGLHVGIIFLIIAQLLKWLQIYRHRWLRLILILSGIWIFAILSGLSSSVLRSALMFSAWALGDSLGRSSATLNIVAASALLLLCVDTNRLFQAGFQLSYSAVIGILLIFPKLSQLIPAKGFAKKISELLLVSIAAQLATLPLVLFYFHQFPNYFLLTNLLVIPIAFATVSLAVLCSTLLLIFGSAFFFTDLLNLISEIMIEVVASIANLPYSVTDHIWLSDITFALLFLSIIGMICYLHQAKFSYLSFSLISLIIALSIELGFDYRSSKKEQFTFYPFVKQQVFSLKKALTAEVYFDSLTDYQRQSVKDHLYSQRVDEIKWKAIALEMRNEGKSELRFFSDGILIDFNDQSLIVSKVDSAYDGLVDYLIHPDYLNYFDFKPREIKVVGFRSFRSEFEPDMDLSTACFLLKTPLE